MLDATACLHMLESVEYHTISTATIFLSGRIDITKS